MKSHLRLLKVFLLILFLNGCSGNDSVSVAEISLEDQTIQVTEQPGSDLLFTLNTLNAINPTYTITSQTPENAVMIDEDGNMIVQDPLAFDFERNSKVIVNVKVIDDGQEDTAEIIININDIPGPQGGLLAYYPFENSPNDLSLNGNNGMIIGDVQSSFNRFNKPNSSYAFTGGRIEVPAFGSNLTSYTISAWIKIENQPSGVTFKTIVSKQLSDASDRDFIFRVSDQNKIMFNTNFDSGSETIVENQWYHVLVINENGFITPFINGEVTDTYTDAAIWDNNNANIIIGGASVANQLETLHGNIDDVLIYNRVLTNEEIQALANNNY